jgi:8-oxo-dGTP pyrophosphatase MutT (NUDIX family)
LLNSRENAEKGANMTAPNHTVPESGFPPQRLAALLAAHLPQSPPQEGGHDDYHVDELTQLRLGGTPAAVLLPVIARPEPVLLFTRRTERLARHPGQVAFPGGRVEAADVSPLATALRETAEETGIAPHAVSVAGYLPRYRTGTGFDIQPVVGVLPPDLALTPDPSEVADIFETPLAFFRNPANRRRESRVWNGIERSFYVFRPGGHEIWGATAALIVALVTRIDGMEWRDAY